jgi:hypothetical protein
MAGSVTVELLVTWICSSWRMIALNTPGLWSDVQGLLHEKDRDLQEPPLFPLLASSEGLRKPSLIKTYLKRSAGAPLRFRLSERALDAQSDEPHFRELLQAFVQHSPRWLDARIFFNQDVLNREPDENYPQDLLPLTGSLPILEHLSFQFLHPTMHGADVTAIPFAEVPKLRSASLAGCLCSGFPLSQITSFDCRPFNSKHFFNALGLGRNLVSISFWDQHLPRWTFPEEPVTSSSIESFTVNLSFFSFAVDEDNSDPSGEFRRLLDSIQLPNLSSISFRLLGDDIDTDRSQWDGQAFMRFISHSSTISHLSLTRQVLCPNEDLTRIFEKLTKLRSLELEEHAVARMVSKETFRMNWVVKLLIVSLERAVVLPELLSLSLIVHGKGQYECWDDYASDSDSEDGNAGSDDTPEDTLEKGLVTRRISKSRAGNDSIRGSFDDSTFVRMVASRCSKSDATNGLSASGLCARLETVKLRIHNQKMQECARTEIQELARREGLRIVVTEMARPLTEDSELELDWDSEPESETTSG